MPTKIKFENEQSAFNFWAQVPRQSMRMQTTFATDEFDDDNDDYFSAGSTECIPNDIPEFITIDLNNLMDEKPLYTYVVPYYQSVLIKQAKKLALQQQQEAAVAAAVAAGLPLPEFPSSKKNRRWWFSKRRHSQKLERVGQPPS